MTRFEGIARSGAMSYIPPRVEKKPRPGRRLLGVMMCAALLGAPLLIPAAGRVASLDRAELASTQQSLVTPKTSTTLAPSTVPPTVVPPFTTAPKAPPTTARASRTKTSARPAVATTAAPKPAARPTTTAAPKPAPKPAPAPEPKPEGNRQSGQASWYDTYEGTCAHKSIPKGTMVNVTNTANGKSVVCRVADRGPYVAGRIIDLDRRLFAQLAPPSAGVVNVNISW